MKKVALILLMLLPLSCFAKIITIYNDSNEAMSFMFANYACVNITPDKFDLSQGTHRQVTLTVDTHRSPKCPQGQTFPALTLFGWASKYNPHTGRNGFIYLGNFLNNPSDDKDWQCVQQKSDSSCDNDKPEFKYYCRAFSPTSHVDFDVYTEDNYISILPPQAS